MVKSEPAQMALCRLKGLNERLNAFFNGRDDVFTMSGSRPARWAERRKAFRMVWAWPVLLASEGNIQGEPEGSISSRVARYWARSSVMGCSRVRESETAIHLVIAGQHRQC